MAKRQLNFRAPAKILTLKDVELVAYTLARELMSSNEPIPDFKTRFPHRLESCLGTPFQAFGGKDAYPGLVAKASILFYLMNKNHPFENGNKRIAMTTLLCFLFINGYWIRVDQQEFYNFAKFIAGSPPQYKDQMVDSIKQFLNKYMIALQELKK
jgi:death-on-curing protein